MSHPRKILRRTLLVYCKPGTLSYPRKDSQSKHCIHYNIIHKLLHDPREALWQTISITYWTTLVLKLRKLRCQNFVTATATAKDMTTYLYVQHVLVVHTHNHAPRTRTSCKHLGRVTIYRCKIISTLSRLHIKYSDERFMAFKQTPLVSNFFSIFTT